jgi:hypothetical protein
MMLCADCDSLRQERHATVQRFRASIRDLVVLAERLAADSEFNLAHRRIRAARLDCDVARAALEHHQAGHGC